MANKVMRLRADGLDGRGLQPIALDEADFQSPLPQQHWDICFSDPKVGLNVGTWDTTTMQEAFGPYPGDEFILVLEGQFAMLDGDDKPMPAKAGQSVIFRNGAPMSWKQEGYLKKFFFLLYDNNAEQPKIETAEGGLIVLEPDAQLSDADDISHSQGGAVQRTRVLWTNDTGNMEVGLWDTQAMTSTPFPFPTHEFAQVLDGMVTITEEDGTRQTFEKGDVFFIPAGTVTTWEVPSYLRKYYAAVTPAD